MNDLIIDIKSQNSLSWEATLEHLSNNRKFVPALHYESIIDFVLNFLTGLIHNQDITLVDSDFTPEEIEKLGLTPIINQTKILNIQGNNELNFNLTTRLLKSKSIITLFSSGTTGLPKKVNHTVESLTRLVRVGERYNRDVWALAYNPTHMAGIQVLFQGLFNGNKLVNIFNVPVDQVVCAIKRNKVTHISATPTFYRMILSTNQEFIDVKRVTLGGEKSSSVLYDKLKFSFVNAKVNNIYASTELGSLLVSTGSTFQIPNHLKGKVRIKENELQVHKSLSKTPVVDEWYGTGDIVEVLSKKPLQFIFKNRSSEMINIGGYKVNPREVEDALLKHPSIIHARVFGRPNSVLGNILSAEIHKIQDTSISKTEIKEFMKTQLQGFKIPRIILFVDKISVTRTGKISRS